MCTKQLIKFPTGLADSRQKNAYLISQIAVDNKTENNHSISVIFFLMPGLHVYCSMSHARYYIKLLIDWVSLG